MKIPALFRAPAFSLCVLFLCTMTPANAAPHVVATIKPLHSLVAGVMAGAGTPDLIIDGAASPHGYSLKPSQAHKLQDADIVFWIGPALEVSLEKPIETIAAKARHVTLIETPGLTLLNFARDEDGDHEGHTQVDGDHDAGHGLEEHHDEVSNDAGGHESEHHDSHLHDQGLDPHIWLDPENARILVQEIARQLETADPENAALYAKNAASMDQRLNDLISATAKRLAPVQGGAFFVFHDAYHYFENRFGLAVKGALTINPDVPAGADKLNEIRRKIQAETAACVFSEPQFDPAMIKVILEDSQARTARLDPLGAQLTAGPDLYFKLIDTMAAAFAGCLATN